MRKLKYIAFFIITLFIAHAGGAQENLTLKGQLSVYTHYNNRNEYPWWNGGRYIPQLNLQVPVGDNRMIDFEASGNFYGNSGFQDFNAHISNGNIKPYRLWARYSTQQLELRVGLQKINFGSASMLRPLMWFDQMDPRDPLQLTDGVWGVLGRYYTLSNTTIWGWILYGNDNPKGWEQAGSHKSVPEMGGRFQTPVGTGEAAVSYHYRVADSRRLPDASLRYDRIPEHRIGFDARFDRIVGYWVEASWKTMGKDMGIMTNQELLNLGVDYTFGIGNGLFVTFEQLVGAFDERPFEFKEPITFSLLNASYPIGLFDNISYILYYDWRTHSAYNFINWQRQFNKLTLHLMGYWNPSDYQIPTITTSEMLFAGTGIQIMLVFNH